jgi:hypothetical protein
VYISRFRNHNKLTGLMRVMYSWSLTGCCDIRGRGTALKILLLSCWLCCLYVPNKLQITLIIHYRLKAIKVNTDLLSFLSPVTRNRWTRFTCVISNNSVVTAQQIRHVFIIKTNRFMLPWEIIAVYFEIHSKHVKYILGPNAKYSNVKLRGSQCI